MNNLQNDISVQMVVYTEGLVSVASCLITLTAWLYFEYVETALLAQGCEPIFRDITEAAEPYLILVMFLEG